MQRLTLFSTSACHLCELAHAMIAAQPGAGEHFSVVEVDISDSDDLFERYGLRIPVLRRRDGEELGWPFSEEELREFLGSGG